MKKKNPIRFASTMTIIRDVKNNGINTEMLILNTAGPAPVEMGMPTEPENFQGTLEELFDKGYQLIQTTTVDPNGDGGAAYYAYLLKPDYAERYSNFMDACIANGDPYHLAIMTYIVKYPEHFEMVWAGPY